MGRTDIIHAVTALRLPRTTGHALLFGEYHLRDSKGAHMLESVAIALHSYRAQPVPNGPEFKA